jgi:hypothetical protein
MMDSFLATSSARSTVEWGATPQPDVAEIPRALFDRLTDTLAFAA